MYLLRDKTHGTCRSFFPGLKGRHDLPFPEKDNLSRLFLPFSPDKEVYTYLVSFRCFLYLLIFICYFLFIYLFKSRWLDFFLFCEVTGYFLSFITKFLRVTQCSVVPICGGDPMSFSL